MPLSRMPSLVSLRAFEAAARRLSFKDAAQELSVTPGAISQQIRALEEDLGVSLFARATRSVSLTEVGRRLQPDVTEGFLKIRDAVDQVRPVQGESLSVSAAGSVIRNWLLPRLHLFTAQHPELQTNVTTLYGWDDFQLPENGVAIRLAKAPPTGFHAREIHRALLIPLASPDFIRRHDLKTPEDARRVPLIHDAILQQFESKSGWETWCGEAGVARGTPDHNLKFDQFAAEYAIDMAISGQGVLLGWSMMCYQALTQGRLCCPFGPIMELDLSYYLICHRHQADHPHIKAFMSWAEQEAAILTTLKSLHLAAA